MLTIKHGIGDTNNKIVFGYPKRIRKGPRVLQHPILARVIAVSTATRLAHYLDVTVCSWLLVQHSSEPSAAGLLLFFRFIPFLILGPWVGIILDRFSRILTFRILQVAMATTAFLFAIAVLTGSTSLLLIYIYTVVMGTFIMAENPTKRTYMSNASGTSMIGRVIAMDMVFTYAGWAIGSNMGGLTIEFVNPSSAYFFVGFVFCINFFVLRRLHDLRSPVRNKSLGGPFVALKEGLKFARQQKAIFGGLVVVGITNFFCYPFESMLPIFANDIYKANGWQFGLLMSASAIGSLIPAFFIASKSRSLKNPGILLIIGALFQALGCIGFSYTQSLGIGFIVIVCLGAISMVTSIAHNTLLLIASPDRVRGRIMGLQILMIGFTPVGALILGYVSDAVGLGYAVRLFGAIGFVLLIFVLFKYPELRKPI